MYWCTYWHKELKTLMMIEERQISDLLSYGRALRNENDEADKKDFATNRLMGRDQRRCYEVMMKDKITPIDDSFWSVSIHKLTLLQWHNQWRYTTHLMMIEARRLSALLSYGRASKWYDRWRWGGLDGNIATNLLSGRDRRHEFEEESKHRCLRDGMRSRDEKGLITVSRMREKTS